MLLMQDAIVEAIRSAVESLLLSSNTARTYATYQAQLPFLSAVQLEAAHTVAGLHGRGCAKDTLPQVEDTAMAEMDETGAGVSAAPQVGSMTQRRRLPALSAPSPTQQVSAVHRPDKLVRVDSRMQTLDAFFQPPTALKATQQRSSSLSQQVTPADAALAGERCLHVVLHSCLSSTIFCSIAQTSQLRPIA
jgi:hypothetical protein